MPCCANSSSVWQTFVTLSVSLIVAAYATTCQHPCNPSRCPAFDPSSCSHGTTTDQCYCCNVCAKGPEELCGGLDDIEGRCGVGLLCVVDIPPGIPSSLASQLPGTCVEDTTEVPQASGTPSSSENTAHSTTEVTPTPTAPVTPDPSLEHCRGKCSVDFCISGSAKTRICSAQDLASPRLDNRDSCQHTSCNACFILVEPNCDMHRCPEPPNKRCLRRYSDCIREHYFNSVAGNILLKLDDPRALNAHGKIICRVPGVGDTSGSES